MAPSIGRIVHYVAPGSADGTYPPAHRAAVITQISSAQDSECGWFVDLMVFNPAGAHWVANCEQSEEYRPFSWHWPEREG